MANWSKREFATLDAALEYLNGVMIGTVNLHSAGADVDGKTFIVHDGTTNRTVNFTAAKGRNWTLDEIIAKINATSGLTGVAYGAMKTPRAGAAFDRRLAIYGDPAHTIRGNGTANAELGFVEGATPANDTVQVIIPNTEVEVFRSTSRDPNQQWVVIHYS
jgi:hypothetical protein